MKINNFENVKIKKKYLKKLLLCNRELFSLYRNEEISNAIWYCSRDNFFFVTNKDCEDKDVQVEDFFKIKDVFCNILEVKSDFVGKIKKSIVYGDKKIYFMSFDIVFDILKDCSLLDVDKFVDKSLSSEDRLIINTGSKIKKLFSFYSHLKSFTLEYVNGNFNYELKYEGYVNKDSNNRLIKNLDKFLLNLSFESSYIFDDRKKQVTNKGNLLYVFNRESLVNDIEFFVGIELLNKIKLSKNIKTAKNNFVVSKMKI